MTSVPREASAEIDLFQQRLEDLYNLVEQAVRKIDPKTSITRTSAVQIDEQLTGTYTVHSLEVAIPGKLGIRLVPKGIYNIGARGRVDARSRLSTQVLVWVEAGGPALKISVRGGDQEIESATRPVFPDVQEGWAWTDNQRAQLLHLTEQVFLDRVLPELVT